jgi:hypothetical protein
MQVRVNVHADVIDPEEARRSANRWLLDNAGNLLAARTAELLLGEQLLWRFDVVLTQPDLEHPGQGSERSAGRIIVDATTGEVAASPDLANKLLPPIPLLTLQDI